jgi:N-acetylmuramic acid 6-phosphate etherase
VSVDRSRLPTEGINPRTADIDTLEPRAILDRIHAEDRRAVEAVGEVLDDVADAVERVVQAFESGGRLIYVGAGTSGRLGVLDAAECPPTFGTDPTLVQAILAGGPDAMWRAREGAEDASEDGVAAIAGHGVSERDVVLGIAAGSTTPFVIGALREAIRRGAGTVFLTCVPPADVPIAGEVDVVVAPLTGPEAIAGSTRMKAGTATKLVLNMLTTTAMIRLGKVYENMMVDLQMTSKKLEERSKRTVMLVTGVSYEEAGRLLALAGGHVTTAVVMILANVDADEARRRLSQVGGFVRQALAS